MPNTLRIKRSTGSTAPTTLANAELAYSEGLDVLYIGVGTGGAGGSATTVKQIATGDLFTSKTAGRVYAAPSGSAGAPSFRALVASDIPSHTHAISEITNLTTTLSGKADLSGATFSGGVTFSSAVALGGSATATTPATSDNSTTVATTAYVKNQGYTTTAGTVTSIGLSLPNVFTVTGSPVTSSGTLTATLASQSQNAVFAGPTSGSGTPAFRALVAADLPSHSHSVSDVFGSQTANTVFAGPNATTGAPTFRALVAGDIPTITAAKISDFDTQVRTSRLDQMASPNTSVAFGSQRITGLADPQNAQDAATKAYVDSASLGLDVKNSVRAASTSPFGSVTYTRSGNVLTANANGVIPSLDNVVVAVGDRILIKDESGGLSPNNGIYTVTSTGSAGSPWILTRATDADTSAEVTAGLFVFVEEGTTNQDTGWVLNTNAPITLNTTGLSFTQFTGAASVTAGTGLTKSGNTLSLTGNAAAMHGIGTTGFVAITGVSSSAAARTMTAVTNSGIVITNGDGVAGSPTFGTTAALASIGVLTPAADRLPYYDSASTATLATLTSFGRQLIDDADNTAARTTLGLGTMATQAASNVNITGGAIDNITIDGGSW